MLRPARDESTHRHSLTRTHSHRHPMSGLRTATQSHSLSQGYRAVLPTSLERVPFSLEVSRLGDLMRLSVRNPPIVRTVLGRPQTRARRISAGCPPSRLPLELSSSTDPWRLRQNDIWPRRPGAREPHICRQSAVDRRDLNRLPFRHL